MNLRIPFLLGVLCAFLNQITAQIDTVELLPVRIVTLHPRVSEPLSLELDYTDQMAHDGGSLLSCFSGFSSIRKSGAYGYDPVFRGFKYEQLNIVLNGAQTASAACPNRMDPPTSQLAPNMIERVEILKGPHALRYGCSFGATVNFIPVPPRFGEEQEVYGRISGGAESNGRVLRTEAMTGLTGTFYDLALFGAWSQGDDYQDGMGNTVDASFSRGSFGTQLGIKVGERQTFTLSATRNTARDVDFPALPMDLRTDDTWLMSLDHQVYFRGKALQSWKTTLYGSYVDHLMNNESKALDPRMVNASTKAETLNLGGRTEGSWSFEQSRLYLGLDYRSEGARGKRTREFLMGVNAGKIVTDNAWQDGRIQRTGVFGEYHLRAGGIRWILSGRVEMNHSQLHDADPGYEDLYPETAEFQVNPGISAGASKSFTQHLSGGIWLGRAVRSGSLTERFINSFPVGLDPYEMVGNPLMEPEVNNQADLNISWKSEKTILSMDLYASYLQNYISSVIDTTLSPTIPSSPGVRRYTNLNKAFRTGFEASWVQMLPANLQLSLEIAYTYGQDLEKKEALPEIAPMDLRLGLRGNYFDQRLRPFAAFRYVTKQERISTEFGETETPSFNLLDIGLHVRPLPWMGLSLSVNNLFDQAYYEHLNRSVRGADMGPIYAPGRSVSLSFSLDFR
jgi:iron complex outermembrane receptor protein